MYVCTCKELPVRKSQWSWRDRGSVHGTAMMLPLKTVQRLRPVQHSETISIADDLYAQRRGQHDLLAQLLQRGAGRGSMKGPRLSNGLIFDLA